VKNSPFYFTKVLYFKREFPKKGFISPEVIIHDRSLLKAKGHPWHKKEKKKGIKPRNPLIKKQNGVGQRLKENGFIRTRRVHGVQILSNLRFQNSKLSTFYFR